MATFAVVGGGITAIGWVTIGGTVALVISMVFGILVAAKSTLQDDEAE